MIKKIEAEKTARENILPFWQGMIDKDYGGFYGEADFYGKINKKAAKGCILNSRVLWTFSAAYRLFNDNAYKVYADHAYDFLKNKFLDKEYGGLFWLADYKGSNPNKRKQFYNIAFGVYALSEYFLATGDQAALNLALDLFDVTEKHGLDNTSGGYIEARLQNWQEIDDYRLSPKEINCPKSMNTCLHVLEAWTTLTRASKNEKVRMALECLLRVTLDKIVNESWNFNLFFDMNWRSLSKEISYGHDIEGSWLMYEAALATGNETLISEVKQTALSIAEVIHTAALDHKNGGLISSCDEEGKLHTKKEWWPQAEAVVGFYNAYELNGKQKYLDAAESIWKYIQKYFIDYVNGEWHNELSSDNSPDTKMPKSGFWKCPYHNGRACFEIIRRIGK